MVQLGPSMLTGGGGALGFHVDMDPSPIIIVAAFDKMSLDIRSFRVPLERSVREVMAPSLHKNFQVRGRPAWAPLTSQTMSQKAALGFVGVAEWPLVRSGALRKVAGQINLWKIDGQEGVATLNVPAKVWYGRVHQEGSGSGGETMYRTRSRRTGQIIQTERGGQGYVPQRVWAIIQPEDLDKIGDVFDRWMDERIAGLVLMI